MVDFISKRKDGRGHRLPLSPKEKSEVFSIRLPKSICKILNQLPLKSVRRVLFRLAKKPFK